MDEKTTGVKMLEALGVQGRIAFKQTKLLELQGEIAKATGDIQQSLQTKALNIKNRDNAESALNSAILNAGLAQQQVTQAKANLKSTEFVVGEAEEDLVKYSDAVLSQLDEITQKFQEAKQAIEVERDEVQKELGVFEKELKTRQAELRASGTELNFGGATSQPKATTL